MKYYIAVNQAPDGPYEVSELLSRGVNASTLVWAEGMPSWQPAGSIPEIAAALQLAGQPTYQQSYPQPYQQAYQSQYAQNQPVPDKPDNYMTWSILLLVCCSPIFGIIALVKANKVNKLYDQGDYDGAVAASEDTKKWLIIGVVVGLILNVIFAFIQMNS